MKPVPPEDFWKMRAGSAGFLDFLLILARLLFLAVGYSLSFVGWLLFFITLLVGASSRLTSDDAQSFRYMGYFIVPGWLMLRFAAGLFPFGRHLFR
jgi:hypothetical protein